jgi:pyruvate/2-oxoglutarate dehydrogenase complex dihydrolipoamide acyltransferase (E2) component
MPQLGESIAEATIVRLDISPGDEVHADDEIMEVETQKAILEVEAEGAGTLLKILVPEETTVEVGDTVSVPSGLPMKGFKSTTLGRTFDTVYFVSAIEIGGTPPAAAPAGQQKEASHGSVPAAGSPHGGAASAKPEAIDAAGVQKVEGGHTVAELFANKAALAGKPVTVRGKVAKFSSGIMGKNWVHLQDGTGDEGSNDLTVTTSGTATVGDTVVVRGTLATDRDFGFGYQYGVMVEDAAVTVE